LSVKAIPFLLLLCLSACIPANDGMLTVRVADGDARPVGLVKPGLHYKYAPGDTLWSTPDATGRARFTTPLAGNTRFELLAGAQRLPVVLSPGKSLEFDTRVPEFNGWLGELHNSYLSFQKQDAAIRERIRAEHASYQGGHISPTLDLFHFRVRLATELFGDTPFRFLVHRMTGEYLVKQLDAMRFSDAIDRNEVLTDAIEHGFFTYESFVAQRAGIRDFTDAWIKSFPGRDTTISEADWKRRDAPRLDSLRSLVTAQISERRARAHASMFLVAERLTETDFPYAEASYLDHIDRYSDVPENVAFLTTLYNDLKRVQPGNPGIAFRLPDMSGDLVDSDSLTGRYVLLDFWASWCVPCLVEFPHMKRLYADYSRADVEFVSISTEEDRDATVRYLEYDPHPWLQLYAGGGFTHPLFKAYKGGGIPFYVLLDRNGNILRYNDIRPSSNLRQVLDDVLAKEARVRSNP
jgi:thiol-disulfide isomerase/thioredoxin